MHALVTTDHLVEVLGQLGRELVVPEAAVLLVEDVLLGTSTSTSTSWLGPMSQQERGKIAMAENITATGAEGTNGLSEIIDFQKSGGCREVAFFLDFLTGACTK